MAATERVGLSFKVFLAAMVLGLVLVCLPTEPPPHGLALIRVPVAADTTFDISARLSMPVQSSDRDQYFVWVMVESTEPAKGPSANAYFQAGLIGGTSDHHDEVVPFTEFQRADTFGYTRRLLPGLKRLARSSRFILRRVHGRIEARLGNELVGAVSISDVFGKARSLWLEFAAETDVEGDRQESTIDRPEVCVSSSCRPPEAAAGVAGVLVSGLRVTCLASSMRLYGVQDKSSPREDFKLSRGSGECLRS